MKKEQIEEVMETEVTGETVVEEKETFVQKAKKNVKKGLKIAGGIAIGAGLAGLGFALGSKKQTENELDDNWAVSDPDAMFGNQESEIK